MLRRVPVFLRLALVFAITAGVVWGTWYVENRGDPEARAVVSAVDAAQRLNMQPAAVLELDLGYDFYGKATYLLPQHEVQVLDSVFAEGVRLRLLCKAARLPAFARDLTELSSGTVAPLVLEEKFAHFPEEG